MMNTRIRSKFPASTEGLRLPYGSLTTLCVVLLLLACAEDAPSPGFTVDGDGAEDDIVDCGGCPAHAACDPASGECRCEEGYEPLGGRCVALPDTPEDGDMEPETPADGDDQETDGLDGDEETDRSPDGDSEEEEEEESSDLSPCPLPQAPALPVIHRGAVLHFRVSEPGQIQTGTSSSATASVPDAWLDETDVTLDTTGTRTVFSRLISDSCRPIPFRLVYEVRDAYPPAAGQEGSTAISMSDPAFLAWADTVESVTFGDNVDAQWKDPDKALGPATGVSTDILSLGDGGQITFRFSPPIRDGNGPDFAVFENSFTDTFLELAMVEVSTDGSNFVRFDHVFLGEGPVTTYGTLDPTQIGGLAGNYRRGFGTPFDLQSLVNRQEVRDGLVALDEIRYVRIVDLVGDGSQTDSFGHPIYDPHPTTESGGFDLEAVGVLNH